MNNDFSDEKHSAILARVKKWTAACEKTAACKALPEEARDCFGMVTSIFAETMYAYHLEEPEQWTARSLEAVLVGIFPRKLVMPPSFYQSVAPVLTTYFAFLNEKGVLKDVKALNTSLKKAAPEMCRRAKDTSHFSPMKQMIMEGIEQGLDLEDTDAVHAFLQNSNPAARVQAEPALSLQRGRAKPPPGKKAWMPPAEEKPPRKAPEKKQAAEQKKEPSLEQWLDLYEAAMRIRRLAPWEFLWDNDLISIMLPGREEPVYCSVMGRNGECYAIGVYPGYESLVGFFRLSESRGEGDIIPAGLNQSCLTCYYGDREEVTDKDRAVFKALNLKFRGRNEWIYFRAMDPGFLPWYITSEQADLLIQTLRNLASACEDLQSGKVEVDFENDQVLVRYYSEKKGEWLNEAAELPPIPEEVEYIEIVDKLLLANLKLQKKNSHRLEFELTYLPAPVQEHKEDRPYLPRFLLLAGRKSGQILDQHLAKPDEDITDAALKMIVGYIQEFGRPTAIYVRDHRTGRYIEDLCEKTGIKLIKGEGLLAISALMTEMMGFLDR